MQKISNFVSISDDLVPWTKTACQGAFFVRSRNFNISLQFSINPPNFQLCNKCRNLVSSQVTRWTGNTIGWIFQGVFPWPNCCQNCNDQLFYNQQSLRHEHLSWVFFHLRIGLHLLKDHPHGRISHDLLNLRVVHGIPSHLLTSSSWTSNGLENLACLSFSFILPLIDDDVWVHVSFSHLLMMMMFEFRFHSPI